MRKMTLCVLMPVLFSKTGLCGANREIMGKHERFMLAVYRIGIKH